MSNYTRDAKIKKGGRLGRHRLPFAPWIITLITLITTAVCLGGCRDAPTADELVRAALDECRSHPAGILYTTAAEPGATDLLDAEMLAGLFGDGDRLPDVLDKINSAAVFLPTRGGAFEIAVIEVASSADTAEVARLCLERTDQVAALPETGRAEREVFICGRYVISLLCPDRERVRAAVTAAM